jgi:hypothetical protein
MIPAMTGLDEPFALERRRRISPRRPQLSAANGRYLEVSNGDQRTLCPHWDGLARTDRPCLAPHTKYRPEKAQNTRVPQRWRLGAFCTRFVKKALQIRCGVMDSDSVSLGSNEIKNLRQTRSGTDPLCGSKSQGPPAIRPSLAPAISLAHLLGSLDQPGQLGRRTMRGDATRAMPQQILTILEAGARRRRPNVCLRS